MTYEVEVLYVSSAPSPSEFERIEKRLRPGAQSVTYGMPQAAFKFHNLIQQGLLEDPRVRVHSLVGRPVSSAFHEAGRWSSAKEGVGSRHAVVHPGFINRPVVKQLSLALRLMWETVRWRARTRRAAHRVAVVDGAYVTGIPLVLLALTGRRISRVGIFADIYVYMADVGDASDRSVGVGTRALRRIHRFNTAHLDAFVVLTQAMGQLLSPNGRQPYVVMEGLVDSTLAREPRSAVRRPAAPVVLYAGALRRQYGVADLVDGFRAWDRSDARLVLLGAGDYAEEIERAAEADERIDFRGSVLLDEVLEAERQAWLLVNPRPVDEDFTRFSFPSKVMEYLASGTAVLTTRLPGLPADYLEHVFTIDRSGPEGITEALARVIGEGPERLEQRGAQGRRFVLQEKNSTVQAARILGLVGIDPATTAATDRPEEPECT